MNFLSKTLKELNENIENKSINSESQEHIKIYLEDYIKTAKSKKSNPINKAFNFANDDEWYTTKEDVQFFIDSANISKSKIIWCPFDLENSNFVTVFRKNGYTVLNSHIANGQDFYFYEPIEKWDIVISNPPFRGKHKLLERLLSFNKPWALIFGIQALNSERFCNMMQNFERPQYVHLKRRMCFTKDHINYDVLNLSRPSFASMWICNDMFKKDIQVWKGFDYKKDGKEFF